MKCHHFFPKPIHNGNGTVCLKVTMFIAIHDTLIVKISSMAEFLEIWGKKSNLEVKEHFQ